MSEHDPRAGFRCTLPIRVRFAEADIQGIVHNSNYLVYADAGLCEYARTLIALEEDVSLDSVTLDRFSAVFDGNNWVRHAEIDFRSPARADERIEVCVRIVRFGGTSYRSLIHIVRDDTLLVALRMTYVWFDPATQQPRPVSPKFIEAVERFEPVLPKRSD